VVRAAGAGDRPAEVPSAVLDALGVREPVIARRAAALAGHVLAACPRLRILATSRQPLRTMATTYRNRR